MPIPVCAGSGLEGSGVTKGGMASAQRFRSEKHVEDFRLFPNLAVKASFGLRWTLHNVGRPYFWDEGLWFLLEQLNVSLLIKGVARRISKHEVQTEGQSPLSRESSTLCVTAVA